MKQTMGLSVGAVLFISLAGCQQEVTRHEQILSTATEALRKATRTLDGVTDAASAQAAVSELPREIVNSVALHQLGSPDPKAKERIRSRYQEFESAASDLAKAIRSLEARMGPQSGGEVSPSDGKKGIEFKTTPLYSAVLLLLGDIQRIQAKFELMMK